MTDSSSIGFPEFQAFLKAVSSQGGKGSLPPDLIDSFKKFIAPFKGQAQAQATPKFLTAEQAISSFESVDFSQVFGAQAKNVRNQFRGAVKVAAREIFSSDSFKPLIDEMSSLGRDIAEASQEYTRLKKTKDASAEPFRATKLDPLKTRRALLSSQINADYENNRSAYAEKFGTIEKSPRSYGGTAASNMGAVDAQRPHSAASGIGDVFRKAMYPLQELGDKGSKPFTLFDTVIGDLFLLQEVSYSLSAVTQTLGYVFVKTNADLEQYLTTLRTTLGTTEQAQKAFSGFAQSFALQVPFFQTEDLISTINKLAAEGFSLPQLTGNLDVKKGGLFEGSLVQSIVDAAAAFGKTPDEAVDAFISATQNRFTRLRQFGISREDLKSFGFAGNADDSKGAAEAQRRIFQVRFGGVAQSLGGTFKGALSNLQDFTTTVIRLASSKSFEQIKDAMVEAAEGAGTLAKAFGSASQGATESGKLFKKYLEDDVGGVLAQTTSKFISFLKFLNEFKLQIATVFSTLAAPIVFSRLLSTLNAVSTGLGRVYASSLNINKIPQELRAGANFLGKATELGGGAITAKSLQESLELSAEQAGVVKGASGKFVSGPGKKIDAITLGSLNASAKVLDNIGPSISSFSAGLSRAGAVSAEFLTNIRAIGTVITGVFKFSAINAVFEIIAALGDLRSGLENTGRVQGLKQLTAGFQEGEKITLQILTNLGQIFNEAFQATTEGGPFLSVVNVFVKAMNIALTKTEELTRAFKSLAGAATAPFRVVSDVLGGVGGATNAVLGKSDATPDENQALGRNIAIGTGIVYGAGALGGAKGGFRNVLNSGAARIIPGVDKTIFGTPLPGIPTPAPGATRLDMLELDKAAAPTAAQASKTTGVARFAGNVFTVLAALASFDEARRNSTIKDIDYQAREVALAPLINTSARPAQQLGGLSAADRALAKNGPLAPSSVQTILTNASRFKFGSEDTQARFRLAGQDTANAGIQAIGLTGLTALGIKLASSRLPFGIGKFLEPQAFKIAAGVGITNFAASAGNIVARDRTRATFGALGQIGKRDSGLADLAGNAVTYIPAAVAGIAAGTAAGTVTAPAGGIGAIPAGAAAAYGTYQISSLAGEGVRYGLKNFGQKMGPVGNFLFGGVDRKSLERQYAGLDKPSIDRVEQAFNETDLANKIDSYATAGPGGELSLAKDFEKVKEALEVRKTALAKTGKDVAAIDKAIAETSQVITNLKVLGGAPNQAVTASAEKAIAEINSRFGPKTEEERAALISAAIAAGDKIPVFIRDQSRALNDQAAAADLEFERVNKQILAESLRGNKTGADALRAKKETLNVADIGVTLQRMRERAKLQAEADSLALKISEELEKAKGEALRLQAEGVQKIANLARPGIKNQKDLITIRAAAGAVFAVPAGKDGTKERAGFEAAVQNAGLSPALAASVKKALFELLLSGIGPAKGTVTKLTETQNTQTEETRALGQSQTADQERALTGIRGTTSAAKSLLDAGAIGPGEYLTRIRSVTDVSLKDPALAGDPELRKEVEQMRKDAGRLFKEALAGRGATEEIRAMNEVLSDTLKISKNINREFQDFGNSSEAINLDTAVRQATLMDAIFKNAADGTEQQEKAEEARNAAIAKTISSYEKLLDLRRKDRELITEVVRAQENTAVELRSIDNIGGLLSKLPAKNDSIATESRVAAIQAEVNAARDAARVDADTRRFEQDAAKIQERIAGRNEDFDQTKGFRANLATVFRNPNIGEVGADAVSTLVAQDASDLLQLQEVTLNRVRSLEEQRLALTFKKLDAERKVRDSLEEQKNLAADLAQRDVQKVRSANSYFEALAKAQLGVKELPDPIQKVLIKRDLRQQGNSVRDIIASGGFREDAQNANKEFAESLSFAQSKGINVSKFLGQLKSNDSALVRLQQKPDPTLERLARAKNEERILTGEVRRAGIGLAKIQGLEVSPRANLKELETVLGKETLAKLRQSELDRNPDKYFNAARANQTDSEIFGRATNLFKAAVDKFVESLKTSQGNKVASDMTDKQADLAFNDPKNSGITGKGTKARISTLGGAGAAFSMSFNNKAVPVNIAGTQLGDMLKMTESKAPLTQPLDRAANIVSRAQLPQDSAKDAASKSEARAALDMVAHYAEAVRASTGSAESRLNKHDQLIRMLDASIKDLSANISALGQGAGADLGDQGTSPPAPEPQLPPKRSRQSNSNMML